MGGAAVTFQQLNQLPENVAQYTRHENYFNGRERLAALGVSIPPEMRALEMVVDWPRITVESLDERLAVVGFRTNGALNDGLGTIWRANDMDANSSLLQVEALVQGRAFGVVGPAASGDIPVISVHSDIGAHVRVDPATRRAVEALIRYREVDGSHAASYYTPGKRQTYRKGAGGWALADTTDSGVSGVPVVPFLNRARIRDHHGRSEMHDVMRYTDAASRAMTNLQVAVELVALPQRYLLGAKTSDFRDQNGNDVPEWQVYIGRLLTGPTGATAGQFQGANLDQISNVLRTYGAFVSGSTGLPLSNLGIGSDNPPSAASLNAQANRHIAKAKKKQKLFGVDYAQLMGYALELQSGQVPSDLIETQWANAATKELSSDGATIAQLVTASVIPPQVAWDLLDLSPEQKKQAQAWLDSAPMASLARSVGA